MGGTRGRHGLTIFNYPNSELYNSGDTGPLLEIRLLEVGGRGICGESVYDGERFCMSSMYECNTDSHTQSRRLKYDMPGGKSGAWVLLAPSDPQLL